jgi:esterase/lipase
MNKIVKVIISTIIFITLVILILFVVIFSQHEISSDNLINVEFESENKKLSGTLILPDDKNYIDKSYPVIIFIHGDGNSERFIDGGYNILINNFLENGIGVFSWDKQGVGNSSGNWLNQTMEQRAQEAVNGLNEIQKNKNVKNDSIGFIGFSQAGWVIPKIENLTNKSKYYIIVSGAINWMEQSEYLTINRLKKEGYSKVQIENINTYFKQNPSPRANINKSYNEYLIEFEIYMKNNKIPYNITLSKIEDEKRYRFIIINMDSDSTKDLKKIKTKTLAVFGDKDLNVNSTNSFNVYNKIFNGNKYTNNTKINHKVIMIKNATHSILNSNKYNFLLESWTTDAEIEYLIEGKSAYGKGYLELLINFTK